jgi:hypothetical protein
MTCDTDHLTATTVPPQDTTICVALELSRSKWLVGVDPTTL